LFELTWNPGLAVGTSNSGTFTITSEYFGTNPLTDPNAVDLGPAPNATSGYSVNVGVGGVPEPATSYLILLGFGMLMYWKRHKMNVDNPRRNE
jgi:hypothetical protein